MLPRRTSISETNLEASFLLVLVRVFFSVLLGRKGNGGVLLILKLGEGKRRHHSVVSATVGPGHVADGNDAIGGPAGRRRSRRSRRMARCRLEQRRRRRRRRCHRTRLGVARWPWRPGHDAVATATTAATTPPTSAADLDARIAGLFRRLVVGLQ